MATTQPQPWTVPGTGKVALTPTKGQPGITGAGGPVGPADPSIPPTPVQKATGGLVGPVGPKNNGPVGPVGKVALNKFGQTPTQVAAMQKFLKNQGYYTGPIDGLRGSGTDAAVTAFHNRNVKGKVQTGAPGAVTGSGGGTDTTTTTTPTPPPVPGVTAPSVGVIDPIQYATGATNSVYNPQLAALAQQIVQGGAQGKMDQKDLQDWYNQLQTLATQQGASTKAGDAAAQAGYDTSSNNALSQLFGGAGASNSSTAEAQTFHDIGAGQLASNDQSDQDFNSRMKTILAASGSEAQNNQLNQTNASQASLAAQKVALLGAKGQAYNANLAQGESLAQQQSSANQAAQLAAALAPAQVATAQAGAITAGATASTAAAIAQANLQKAEVELKAAQTAAGGKLDMSNTAQRGQLQSSMETLFVGPRGGLKSDPGTAWAQMNQQLVAAGLQNDPQAKQVAIAAYRQALEKSHSLSSYGGWAWNGNKPVQTGNSYKVVNGKAVLVNSAGQPIKNYVPKP